jgi:CheY-like chemotaxis protein
MASHHILVVDDEAPMRLLLEKTLAGAGYRVTAVSDGMAALQAARADVPDLVVLDLSMPGIDGYSVCGMLKRGRSFKAPVVILSARSRERDQQQAFDTGADAYLTKPVDRELLLSTVAGLIRPAE